MNDNLDLKIMHDIDSKLRRGESPFNKDQERVNNLIKQINHCLCGHFESCPICLGKDYHNESIYNELKHINNKEVIKDANTIKQMESFSNLSEQNRSIQIKIKAMNIGNKKFYEGISNDCKS